MDVAQMPGWATWLVGLEGEALLMRRLSGGEGRERKEWTDLKVAGLLVEVRVMRSVIRLVCS